MDFALILVITIIVVALVFDYTNGFHDAANAIATAVGSKSLKPRTALFIAACGNLVGAFISEGVAKTVGSGIIDAEVSTAGLFVVLAGLIGAITWNLITWWFGLPSSSSHALIGGLAGAALAASQVVYWNGIAAKVLIPMILSPLIGFTAAYALATGILWTFRNATRAGATKGFKYAQATASTAMAVGHGLQDAQKTMGVMTLALVAGGFHSGDSIPFWVKVSAALAISLGTYAGGWKIMATLGSKVTEMDLPRGLAAQSVASTVLYVMAIGYQAPISTTHTITSSILGAGATRGKKFVHWGVVRNILGAWILTLPGAGSIAAISFYLFHALFHV